MTEPVTGVRLLSVGARIRRTSLVVKLTVLGAAVTAAVIVIAFWALSVETREGTRRILGDELNRHQRALLESQKQNLTQLIASAAVVTQSPNLRAALGTTRLESNLGNARRDLAQTVQQELRDLVSRLDRELLVVTDEQGRVFAAASRTGTAPARGTDLGGMIAVRHALDPAAREDHGELAVYRDGDVAYQVAVYPFVQDGYTIGALLLGERLDEGVVASARAAFEGQIVVTAGQGIIAWTSPVDSGLARQLLAARGDADTAVTVLTASDELVAAPLALGQTQTGEHVRLWLLQPLSGTVRALTRPLLRDFLLYGTLAVLVAAMGAGYAARSVLRSFRDFVGYMRSGAAADRIEQRFDATQSSAEVRVLNKSLQQLMDSIAAKREELERRTSELTAANAVLTDEVRQRQRVEVALQESEAQLRQAQKLEAVGTLAGGIAHDFNNLLTAVSGFTQLALMNSDPNSPVASDLRQVVEAADRAAHLTKQLLAFSRKQVLQPTVLDLGEVVHGVVPMLGRLLGEHIRLDIAVASSVPRVLADRGQIEQVIMNLVINARDAMPQGGVLTIRGAAGETPDAGSSPDRAVLTVADSGTGIPEAIRDRIFEPFFTTKESGKGTGLGLSTVYGIVKQSGGSIDLDSILGRGTTFTITLPAASDALAPGFVADRMEELPGGTEAILLVEDDNDVRTLARRTLEHRGYTVMPARDADEALEIARHARVDVLLSDMVMPRRSGPELAASFARLHPQAVIIFMSGYADDALTAMGMTIGSALLRKPFTPAALARTVRDVIDAARDTRHVTV